MMFPQIEITAIDGFVAGATPLLLKWAYDKVIGNAPADLRRRIDDLHRKVNYLEEENSKLLKDNNSKDETISILTGELTSARREKSQLMDQLTAAANERAAALKVKSSELRRALADEKNCKKRVDELTQRVGDLSQQLRETTTGTELANMRVQALETGQDLGAIAVTPHR